MKERGGMNNIISLSGDNIDWELLARVVERSGLPLWLELGGTVQGVLLPSSDARRLMGHYTAAQVPRPERYSTERSRPEVSKR